MPHVLVVAGLAALSMAHPSTVPTATVSYADLDLASAHGRDTLEARVRGAARQVCEIGTGHMRLEETIAARACYVQAVSGAHQQFASIEASRTRMADRR